MSLPWQELLGGLIGGSLVVWISLWYKRRS